MNFINIFVCFYFEYYVCVCVPICFNYNHSVLFNRFDRSPPPYMSMVPHFIPFFPISHSSACNAKQCQLFFEEKKRRYLSIWCAAVTHNLPSLLCALLLFDITRYIYSAALCVQLNAMQCIAVWWLCGCGNASAGGSTTTASSFNFVHPLKYGAIKYIFWSLFADAKHITFHSTVDNFWKWNEKTNNNRK